MKAGTKIFLVNNDFFSLNNFQRELENLGYTDIYQFLNSTVCLNNLYREPDVIFLDQEIGGETGFDLLKRIKRYGPNIYVVLLSSQADMKTAVDALKQGAFDYIIKGNEEAKKIYNVMSRISSIREERIKSKRLRMFF